jgi:hypothetical protein
MSNQTEVLSLRVIRTDKGYMLKHTGAYVCDRSGAICWATLDDVMEVFSKLVLSDALIPPIVVDLPPQCTTPYMNGDIEC